MPNQKVPQLPILTAITGSDLFYVVDVSDTTDDPTGSSKQITRDEGMHCDFACHLFNNHIENKISEKKIKEIICGALEIIFAKCYNLLC